MISKRCLFASFLIAASALTTLALAENVYKCGTTYSQSPCPGGKQVNVDDSRDPQQKKLKDDITQRDAELARGMEKDRLTNEKALRAADAKHPFAAKTPAQVVVRKEPILSKPKRLKHKTVKQLGFVAEVPGSRHPTTKKKSSKKTEIQTQP
jgi:hypothetical protein